MLRRHLTKLLVCAVVLHLLAAGWYATVRPIDGDEGYYGLAARLVTEGRAPYMDFFYPQAPLLPYLYAPGAALAAAPQLPGLRMVSVLLSALAIGLAAWWLRERHAERPAVALGALLLAVLSPELLLWQTTVKTYAWCNLAAFAAFVALERGAGERRATSNRWLLAGGVALGLGIAARLLYAPLAVTGAVWILATAGRGKRLGAVAAWTGGVVIGLVPVWATLAADPAAFWFNNVRYHELRLSPLADASWLARGTHRLTVLARAVLLNPALLLLLVLAVRGAVADRAARLAMLLAGTLTLASLLPEPVHRQYFTATLPLLLLPAAAAGLAAGLATRLAAGRGDRSGPLTAASVGVTLVVSVLWLGVVRPEVDRAPPWQLDHYRRVSRLLAAVTRPDDVVFSFWSGYVGGSGRQAYPGLENHFAVSVSERLDMQTRRRFHIAGRHEMAAAFREEVPAAAVIGVWMHDLHHVLDNRRTQDLLDLFNQHYGFFDEVQGVKLCKRRRDLGAAPPP